MLKIKNIVKLKAIYLADMTLNTKNISDYIKKYFGKNYIIEQDKDLGWYNFKIGNKKYEDRLLQEINEKYKVYLKEGYWYLDLIED